MTRALRNGTAINGYRIEDVLSDAGNFAVVYLATDMDEARLARRRERIAGRLGRWGERYGAAAAQTRMDPGPLVAIKEYFPRGYAMRAANGNVVAEPGSGDVLAWGRERFSREGEFLIEHSHPGVVAFYDRFTAFGTEYHVMERLAGGSLADLVERDGPQSEAQVRRWLLPLLEGLNSVERRDANHLDISPGNVMFRVPGIDPVLVDFGAARIGGRAAEHSSRVVIDDNFAAPEKYQQTSSRLDARADVYSLGAIINYALTGELPARSNERLVDLSRSPGLSSAAQARRAKMASGAFLKVVDQAFATESNQRFSDAGAMHQALSRRGVLGGSGKGASDGNKGGSGQDAPRDTARDIMIVGLFVAAAICIVLILYGFGMLGR